MKKNRVRELWIIPFLALALSAAAQNNSAASGGANSETLLEAIHNNDLPGLQALADKDPAILGAAPGTETTGDHAVVEKVIRDNIGWALTKDRPLLESTMAQDERLFIFNPDSEVTRGWEQFAKNFDFWLDPHFKATGLDIRDLRIDFSPLGDAAWWSCILDDLYEWNGKPGAWKDTRWTGVLEKRDGRWRIVQMHFSFAADKVAAEVKAKLAQAAAATAEKTVEN